MMKRIYALFLLILFFLACADPSSAQKVAVVLSGGGSKASAIIVVLKALEEARIPIDYIAGTSMGAIIGGLYAAGYSRRTWNGSSLPKSSRNGFRVR
jgi:NTE family protein